MFQNCFPETSRRKLNSTYKKNPLEKTFIFIYLLHRNCNLTNLSTYDIYSKYILFYTLFFYWFYFGIISTTCTIIHDDITMHESLTIPFPQPLFV